MLTCILVYCYIIHNVRERDQPGCISTDDLIKKILNNIKRSFIHLQRENEIVTFPGKWMQLEIIKLRETSQTKKGK